MSSSLAPVKILTVGSAAGSIRDLFSKIKAIDAKHGKFDFVLCTGDFFGPLLESDTVSTSEDEVSKLINGELETPLECYIMQGDNPLPGIVIEKFAKTGGQLCRNVFLMNKSGIVTTENGLRIACLGGIFNADVFSSSEAAPGFASPFFTTQTIEKLLSNTLMKSTAASKTKNYTSLSAIQSTAAPSQLVDVLLTYVWPSTITQFSSVPLASPDVLSVGAQALDDVIRRTQPRYHFAAGGGQFWEREPFLWDQENRATRFVSLGAFGGAPVAGKKQRWFYAFSISPVAAPAQRPANATKNPFLNAVRAPKRPLDTAEGENFIFGNVRQPVKRSRIENSEPGKPPPGYKCRRCESTEHFINDCPDRTVPPEGYVCKICNEPGHLVRDCPTKSAVGDTGGRKPREGYVCRACGSDGHYLDDCPVANANPRPPSDRRRGAPREIAPSECWFCLSNPNLAKHLIVSIGNECYVTLPKGQIVPTQSSIEGLSIPGGGHVLIVPITHYPTYSTIPADLAEPIVSETEKYKSALRAMYAKNGASCVAFEVGRLSAKGGHAHVQMVPIPLTLQNSIEDAFLQEGKLVGIDFETDPEVAMESYADGRGSYFKVDLPDGRKMIHLMKDSVPFSIQFGRQVLVNLLNMPERLDWKTCMLSDDDDKADAQAFKAGFSFFDPSL